MALKSSIDDLKSYLKAIAENEFYILPNTKAGATKDDGKN